MSHVHVHENAHGSRVLSQRSLIRIQAATGLAFALFLVVHIANTVAALAGPGAYDRALAVLRLGYQRPIVELLLLTTLAAHIGAGLWRYFAFHRGRPVKQPTTRWHRWAGRALAAVVVVHVLATRGPAWVFGLTVDMSFVAYSLEHAGWFYYPYYIALFAVGCFHLLRGVQVATASLGLELPRRWLRMSTRSSRWAIGLSAVLAAAALMAIGGVLWTIDRSNYPAIAACLEQVEQVFSRR